MKRCFRCGETKPLTEFYAHPMMADGHLGKCKPCTRRDVAQHRAENIERIREKDRERAKAPHAVMARARYLERWVAKWPERRRAHVKVQSAIRKGAVSKPSTCQRCGVVPRRIEAHHWDYTRPLLVEWLCKPCHAVADEERRRTGDVAC